MPEPLPPPGGETYRAGPPKLGARLLAAAGLVRPGVAVADIGCDHGKLAVHLALAGSPRVIAVDNRPLPLARAAALARQTGAAVECRLGDGLSALAPGEVEDIVVAGLSGESIAGLLAACPWVRSRGIGLVLLPVSRAEVLRRWLCEEGFAVRREVPVAERGHFYSALAAEYDGVCREAGALFLQVGRVPETPGAAARGYIRARLRNLENRRSGPLPPEEQRALERLIMEVEECLK